MDQQQIKTLIDALAASDLAELEYRDELGCTLRLVKQSALRGASLADRAEAAGAQPAVDTSAASAGSLCLAPLYGVLHLQPAPGESPYVQPGQAVTAGQTLCVIEAMKVFNEVRAERDGTIDAVLAESGQEVEAGQPLFRLS